MKNIFNIFSVLSLALSGGLTLTLIVGYFVITNPNTQEKLKQQLLSQVGPLIESQIKNSIPGLGSGSGGFSMPGSTGGVVPFGR